MSAWPAGNPSLKRVQWGVAIVLLLLAGYLTSSWLQRMSTVEAVELSALTLPKRFQAIQAGREALSDEALREARKTGQPAVDRIKKRHLFAPEPGQPFRSISGVLGQEVVFGNGQAVRVGGNMAGAKVVAVGSDWVELEYEGEQIILGVHGGRGSYQRDMEHKQQAEAKRLELMALIGMHAPAVDTSSESDAKDSDDE